MTKEVKQPDNFSIGQIVYILSNTGKSIIPAMIVQESTVETITERKVSWKLAIGAANNPEKPQRVEDSSNINGEIFSSIEKVEAVLKTRLTKFLKDVVTQGKKREEVWYGSQKKKLSEKTENAPNPKDPNAKLDPESLLEEIEGTEPEITVVPPVSQKELSEEAQKKNLQNRLRDLATPSEEELTEEESVSSKPQEQGDNIPMGTIEGPDGTRIPVNLKL